MSLIPTQRTICGMALVVATAVLLAPAGPLQAQGTQGEPADLAFRIVNASTGEPGTVERLTISYIMVMPEIVVDTRPQGTAFVVEDVTVKPDGRYIIAVWSQGVPYYFSRKGRVLVAEEQELQVFDATSDLADARITGMNVVVKREGDLLHLEYMLQVSNDNSPQRAIYDPEATFSVFLHSGAEHVEAEYRRGPNPTPVPVVHDRGDTWQLGVPLTPGANRLFLKAVIPWREGMELPVGAELPVEAWSLLATPDWLEVDNRQLEPDPDTLGMKRMIGPPLDADQKLDVRLGTGADQRAPEEKVFTTEAPAADAAPVQAAEEGGGLPKSVLVAAAMLIAVVGLVLFRRRS